MIGMEIARIAVRGISTLGVSQVISNVVKTTTPVGAKTLNKVLTSIGELVITAAASDAVDKWVSKFVFNDNKDKPIEVVVVEAEKKD
jgi:hypothetical protein